MKLTINKNQVKCCFFFFRSVETGVPGENLSVQGPVSRKSRNGHISGRIILFLCSKRRRLEARNFAVILIYIPFTTYEKTSFTELAGRSFTNGFSGPKCFRYFRETGPRVENQQTQPTNDAGSGNRTRATLVGGECSHQCAIPAYPVCRCS